MRHYNEDVELSPPPPPSPPPRAKAMTRREGGGSAAAASAAAALDSSGTARLRHKIGTEPQPEWTKAEGSAGEARIVYTNKAKTAGVDTQVVRPKAATMDSSLRARFQGLLGGLAGKLHEQVEAGAAAGRERAEAKDVVFAFSLDGKAMRAADEAGG